MTFAPGTKNNRIGNGKQIQYKLNYRTRAATHRFGDVARRPEFPELEVAGVLGDGLSEHLRGGRLSLGLHDLLLLLLQGPVHHESCPLCLLLRNLGRKQEHLSSQVNAYKLNDFSRVATWVPHLLGLDSRGVLPAEAELGDGDVIEDDVEVPGPVGELFPDHHGDLLALRDELRGVELGDHALEHLVADGGQHLLVEVDAQLLVHDRDLQRVGAREDAQRNVDHLQVLGARRRGDLPGARADVVDDGVLEPRDSEVQPLGVDLLLYAADSREDDGAVTALNWKEKKAENIVLFFELLSIDVLYVA